MAGSSCDGTETPGSNADDCVDSVAAPRKVIRGLWGRDLFLPVVYLVAVPAVMVGVALYTTRTLDRQVNKNARTLTHLCALTTTIDAVWRSAIESYASLPDRTPDQSILLTALRTGDHAIKADTTCPKKGAKP